MAGGEAMRSSTTGVILALAALGSLGAAGPRDAVIEVDAGPIDRRETPVVVPLPEGLAHARGLTMEGLDDHLPIAVQLVPGERPGAAWILRDLPAGASRRYRLAAVEAPTGGDEATCTDDGKDLLLKAGGRPVLRYHHAVVESPPGLDPVYRRSGQIHPLYTPSGLVVTDDFPPDHAHQHGLFFAWVNTTFGGHRVDFWNQAGRTGRVRHVETLATAGGPVFGQFAVRLRHEDLTGPDAPTPVLDEVWTVRAYHVSGPFLVDFETRQTCAGAKPLEINRYHYGGFGLRGQRAWFDPGVKGEDPPDPARSGRSDFLTSEGKHRADGNHTRARWVDLSGLVDDRFGGVAVLGHPDNLRAPQPVRLHPNKPYLSFAPEVLGGFTIAPDSPYTARYRLATHDGPPDPAALDRLWRDYAEPPRVRVVEAR
jgi:hypothetical protein